MLERVLKLALVACAATALTLSAAAQAQQRDIMLVLDNSGSMKKNDPDFLTLVAVKAFIAGLEGDTHLGILVFDEDVNVTVPLSPLNVDTRGRYLGSLSVIDFRGQWTHSSAALERALYELRTDGRLLAEKSIIFMTDGIVDTGDAARDLERTRWMQTELVASALESSVRIFGIAFTDNADFQLIQSLAHRSGGEYYRAYQATDIEQVFESIDTALGRRSVTTTTLTPADTLLPLDEPLPDPVSPPELMEPSLLEAAVPDAEPPSLPQPTPLLPTEAVPTPQLPTAVPDISLPTLDPPAPGLPSLQPAPVADTGSSFLAELSTPASAADADAAEDGDESPPLEPPDASLGSVEVQPLIPGPGLPLESSEDFPLYWLLAGVGGLAMLIGAGVFIVVRRRLHREKPAPVPKAFLNDLGGATDKSSHELGEMPTVIGRLGGPEGDAHHYIVIDESTIGRRHAIIDYTEHAYWVADQNSLNGTFVNDHRIKERARLKHGDRLRFHRKEFEFVLWEMFETDRTEMSQTLFTSMLDGDGDGRDTTQMRADITER